MVRDVMIVNALSYDVTTNRIRPMIDNMAGSSERFSCLECGDTLLLKKNLQQHYLRSHRDKGVKYKSTTSKNISDFVKKGRFGVKITGAAINCSESKRFRPDEPKKKSSVCLLLPQMGACRKDFRL